MGDFIFGDLRTLSAAIAIGLGGFAPAIAIGMLAGKAIRQDAQCCDHVFL